MHWCRERMQRRNKIHNTPLMIGNVQVRNPVILAPMSGVTDTPFRAVAFEYGVGMVVTEMVACKQLLQERPDVLLRADNSNIRPFVIQLAGRDPYWMGEGARMAEALGADIIDINMGCPAKQVTSGLSGSALMRDLDLAVSLIEATVAAVNVPVTVKMRLGWDENSLNAPELAIRAQLSGAQMVTVHGRTRCQFYKGKANWKQISKVKDAVQIPVIANGDVVSVDDVTNILEQSKADGVMIGRGACGSPWFLRQAAEYLKTGTIITEPSFSEKHKVILQHYKLIIDHYGELMGVRNARKHLGWYLEKMIRCESLLKKWRSKINRENIADQVVEHLNNFFEDHYEVAA